MWLVQPAPADEAMAARVEQGRAALGAELDAADKKGVAQGVPDDCWATPEDGWAALANEMAPKPRVPTPPPAQAAIPSFEEFAAGNHATPPPLTATIPSFEQFVAGSVVPEQSSSRGGAPAIMPQQDQGPTRVSTHDAAGIPSFEEFKAANNAASSASQVSPVADPLLAMRHRDPSVIENGWAALGAELDGGTAATSCCNSVEDGWAALGAELEARPPATWSELGGDDAARRAAICEGK